MTQSQSQIDSEHSSGMHAIQCLEADANKERSLLFTWIPIKREKMFFYI